MDRSVGVWPGQELPDMLKRPEHSSHSGGALFIRLRMAVKASVLLSSYFTSVWKTSDSPERNVHISVYIEIHASVKNKYKIVSVYITQAT